MRVRPRLILVVVCCAALAVSMMQSVLIPLLPELPRLLGVAPDDASWLVTATVLAGAVSMPSISRLADMYGKRRIIVLCLVFLFVGSMLALVSSSLVILIIARALQGLSLALVPVAISILRDELPSARLALGIAIVSATMGLGGAIGLPLTGIVYNAWGWHAMFWTSAGMAVAAACAVLLFVPESRERTGGRFDLVGAGLLSVVLLALLLGITRGNHWGWFSWETLTAFAVSAVTFVAWLPWELRVRQPLVDLRTSARRPVLLTNIAALLVGFATFSNMLVTTQQLQLTTRSGYGLGLSVLAAGIAFVPVGLVFVVAVPLAARISRQYGPHMTLAVGGLVMAVGFAARPFMMSSLAGVVIGASAISVGMTLSFAALPVLIMRHVPIHETAAANGLNTVVRIAGIALASAVIAAVLAGMTARVGGQVLPKQSAFHVVFILGAVAALASAAVAFAVGRSAATESRATVVMETAEQS